MKFKIVVVDVKVGGKSTQQRESLIVPTVMGHNPIHVFALP